MLLKRCFAALAACFLALQLPAATPAGHPRFAHESSDLKPDAHARFGTLPNGMSYVVLPNKEPKARASLRLLVMAGSLQEEDDQQGLAHFLEHMAFNGSAHYPPGTLVEYFQRLGMSFGGDTNAYTSYDHTAYMIELPDTQPHMFEEGFRVFADFAGGLSLLAPEIDKERGIVLSEKRARDSVEYRQHVAEFEFLLGETRFSKRMPIGSADVIQHAARERFTHLYDTWYRPERMAVVAVGDFDPAMVEKQIEASFGSLKSRAPAQPDPEYGRIPVEPGLHPHYHREAEAGATTVSIQTIIPYPEEPDTAANRLKYLPRDLAVAMLNRRLSILAKKEDAPFNHGRASVFEGYDLFRNASIEVTCKPDQWRDALAVAEKELRRALEHGFQAAELAEVSANFLNALDQAVKTAPTRRSDDLAADIVRSLADGTVFTTPADDRELFAPAIAKLTPEECAAGLRESFSSPAIHLVVMGNAKIEGDAPAAIAAAYEKSRATPVDAPAALADAAFAYTDFGPPGKVVERNHIDDLDITLVRFANGVRLNLKKTDFEAGEIRLSARIGTGQLTEPKDQPGLAFFASATFAAGGLGQHSVDDLQRILAGKNVGVGFRVGSDALAFNTATNREDLLLQLQLLAAYVRDPGYRPESLRMAQKGFEQLYIKLDHTPAGPLQRDVPRLLASGDPRFGLPPKDVLLSRTLDETRAWLTPQLATGAIELAFVGDLDPEAVIDAVARTFGALPPRAEKPPLIEARQVNFPSEPFSKEFAVATEIPKGVASLYWPTTDNRDVRLSRRLNVLGDVFSDRLRVKIREQLGESYSPRAGSAPSDTYRDYGFLHAMVTTDPSKTTEVVDAVLAIADDLVKDGITEDELERAKKPILTALRESTRNNAYWLDAVLKSAQERPEHLDWARTRLSDHEAITVEDLNAVAKTYLPANRAFRVTVVPEKSNG